VVRWDPVPANGPAAGAATRCRTGRGREFALELAPWSANAWEEGCVGRLEDLAFRGRLPAAWPEEWGPGDADARDAEHARRVGEAALEALRADPAARARVAESGSDESAVMYGGMDNLLPPGPEGGPGPVGGPAAAVRGKEGGKGSGSGGGSTSSVDLDHTPTEFSDDSAEEAEAKRRTGDDEREGSAGPPRHRQAGR
jgi:hypothetical protein